MLPADSESLNTFLCVGSVNGEIKRLSSIVLHVFGSFSLNLLKDSTSLFYYSITLLSSLRKAAESVIFPSFPLYPAVPRKSAGCRFNYSFTREVCWGERRRKRQNVQFARNLLSCANVITTGRCWCDLLGFSWKKAILFESRRFPQFSTSLYWNSTMSLNGKNRPRWECFFGTL